MCSICNYLFACSTTSLSVSASELCKPQPSHVRWSRRTDRVLPRGCPESDPPASAPRAGGAPDPETRPGRCTRGRGGSFPPGPSTPPGSASPPACHRLGPTPPPQTNLQETAESSMASIPGLSSQAGFKSWLNNCFRGTSRFR